MSNVAVVPKEETQVAVPIGQIFDLTGSITTLPDLSKAIEVPLDLMSDYWTPKEPGEAKNVFFDRIDLSKALDQQTNEVIDLECAYFLEQDSKGEIRSVRNGSKRLVGALAASGVKRGTALRIIYQGAKQNRSNSFKSDSWSIKPLKIAIDD